MSSKHQQAGFTLVELMVATVMFAVVLIIILASFLQVGRMYYKGISYSNTQEAARRVSGDLSNDVRFNSSNNYQYVGAIVGGHQQVAGTNTYYFCVGQHRYVYTLFEKVTAANISNPLAGIQQTTHNSGCPPPTGDDAEAGTDMRQLLGVDMQLNRLSFVCANDICNIGMHIIFYGADSLVFTSPSDPGLTPQQALRASDARCTGALVSSQFCAAVDLNTTVLARQ